MFHQDGTIAPPNYELLLRALLSEFGITDTQKYFDLFKRYFGMSDAFETIIDGKVASGETGENHLLQIFISPTVVNDVVYLAGSMGKGLYATAAEQKAALSPKQFLEALRRDPQGAHEKLLLSDLNDEKGGGLHRVQARLFMKPEIMSDPNKVQIVRYTKKPIQERYFQELREMVRADLTNWLANRYELQKDTLENPTQEDAPQAMPPLQKVERHFDQAEGKIYNTKTPEELYGRFLLDDNVEGIKQILARNPDFDLLKEIPNPEYQASSLNVTKRPTINPMTLVAKTVKIREHIKSKLLENHIVIAQSQDAMSNMNDQTREIYIVGPVHLLNLDLSHGVVLEKINIAHNAHIEKIILPNSPALKELTLLGNVAEPFDLNLEQANNLEILNLNTNINKLTIPNSTTLKEVSLNGLIKEPFDLNLEKANNLGHIELGANNKIGNLILPNSSVLKKINLVGAIETADLSRASALENITMNYTSKIGMLKLSNSPALKKINLVGEVRTADLSKASALE
ncbi:MAG: hypothetical protein Q8K36_05240, partial [Alphaproteobacteria bacterium]|nr:hypothetical protein [Alphaproteobacteria bacterium]